jgi:hypothetical protein
MSTRKHSAHDTLQWEPAEVLRQSAKALLTADVLDTVLRLTRKHKKANRQPHHA